MSFLFSFKWTSIQKEILRLDKNLNLWKLFPKKTHEILGFVLLWWLFPAEILWNEEFYNENKYVTYIHNNNVRWWIRHEIWRLVKKIYLPRCKKNFFLIFKSLNSLQNVSNTTNFKLYTNFKIKLKYRLHICDILIRTSTNLRDL